MEVKNCAYCGGEFVAKTKRAKYCCETCRKYNYKHKNRGATSVQPAISAARLKQIKTLRPIVTEFEVQSLFADLNRNVIKLDVCAKRAPEQYRDVCRVVGNDINQALRRVGL